MRVFSEILEVRLRRVPAEEYRHEREQRREQPHNHQHAYYLKWDENGNEGGNGRKMESQWLIIAKVQSGKEHTNQQSERRVVECDFS